MAPAIVGSGVQSSRLAIGRHGADPVPGHDPDREVVDLAGAVAGKAHLIGSLDEFEPLAEDGVGRALDVEGARLVARRSPEEPAVPAAGVQWRATRPLEGVDVDGTACVAALQRFRGTTETPRLRCGSPKGGGFSRMDCFKERAGRREALRSMLGPMRAGEIAAGRFVVEKVIGSGGMGSVFSAVDRVAGGRVALKVLNLASEGAVERFWREAHLLSELSHPAVVRYVAHGQTDDHVPYLAMELLAGEDLEQRLRRGPLRVDECVALATRVADALVFAHGKNIVHRDLKPSNLFLVDGEPTRTKILDLGVAKPLAATHPLTRSGMLMGTIGYMAPEHAFGDVAIDPRSDLFSLGCVLFEALVGRSPFAAKHVAAVFAKVIHFEPPRLGTLVDGIPRALEQLVQRLLSKSPDERPRTAKDVLASLGSIGATIAAARAPAYEPRLDASGVVAVPLPQPLLESAFRGAEQKFASVVLVELPEVPLGDRTLRSDGALANFVDAARVITRLGGEPARIGERSFLGLFRSGRGEARDQATRAAACARALQEGPQSTTAAIAIATGTADGTRALGRAVELAADLLASAGRSGTTIVDAVTARLISGHFELKNGKIMEKWSKTTNDEVEGQLLGKPTPFVGRRKDLALLCATLEGALDDRVVRRVVVTGASGMGKTRLRREFVRRARRELNPLVLQAAGDVVRAGSSASLGKQLVRAAVQLREAEAVDIVQRRIAAHLDKLVVVQAIAGGEARDLTFEFLCELLEAPVATASHALRMARTDPGAMAERVARAFVALLCAECARSLVLIVLDDVQWGDAGTLRYLDRVIEELGERPLMIAAFARPEALDAFPELSPRGSQHVELPRLGFAASVQLVRAALGDAASDVVADKIALQAEGNAFYLEELIRHVAEGGSVDQGLPDTVLAMAQARFDRLEPEARRLLRAGSVFGEIFWEQGIIRLLGDQYASHPIEEWLQTLVDRELLKTRDDSRFMGQKEHAFRHSLVREAAYASLSNDDRRSAHGVVAAWLEECEEHDPLAIADHWDRSRERSRAAPYFSRAAFLSLERQDESATQACVHRGLACEPDDGVRCALLTAAGFRGFLASDWDTAVRCTIEALPLATRGTEGWYTLVAGIITAESFRGRVERAPELILSLLDSDLPVHQSMNVGRSLFVASGGLLIYGERALAEAVLSRMDTLERSNPGAEPGFSLYYHVAWARWHMWATTDYGSALRHAERARALCSQVVDTLAQLFALHVYANVIGVTGPREAMLRVSEQIRDTRMARQFEFWFSTIALNYELTRGAKGSSLEVGMRSLPEATTPLDRAFALYFHAHLHLVAGEYDGVERHARELLVDAPPLYHWFARACLAFGALHGGDGEAAFAHTERGMQVSIGAAPIHRSLLLLAHAESLRAIGRNTEAMDAIAAARSFVLACVSGLPDAAREDCLHHTWVNVRVLRTAGEWLGG